MASIKRMIKKPSLTPKYKDLCIEWSQKCMAVVMKTVLFTDSIMHEDDHAKRWSSLIVPVEDYQAIAQLIFSGTSNTFQRAVSVLQIYERGQWPYSNHSVSNHNYRATLLTRFSHGHSTIIIVENPSFSFSHQDHLATFSTSQWREQFSCSSSSTNLCSQGSEKVS